MKTKLIGLYSSAPQSGKTTTAEILVCYDYRIVSFAEPLKKMTVQFLMGFGYSKGDAERIIKDKNFVIGEVELRVRDIMQRLGTEWGRKAIHPDVWIKMWESKQRRLPLVVVDDMRFPNEYKAVKRQGGLLIRIERGKARSENREKHESEGALDNFEFDHVIYNNGSIPELEEKIVKVIGR